MQILTTISIVFQLLIESPETLIAPPQGGFTTEQGYKTANYYYKKCGNWASNDDGTRYCFPTQKVIKPTLQEINTMLEATNPPSASRR